MRIRRKWAPRRKEGRAKSLDGGFSEFSSLSFLQYHWVVPEGQMAGLQEVRGKSSPQECSQQFCLRILGDAEQSNKTFPQVISLKPGSLLFLT